MLHLWYQWLQVSKIQPSSWRSLARVGHQARSRNLVRIVYLGCFRFQNEGVEGSGSNQEKQRNRPYRQDAVHKSVEQCDKCFPEDHELEEVGEHLGLHIPELLPGDGPGQDAAGDEDHPHGGPERYGVREKVQESQHSAEPLMLRCTCQFRASQYCSRKSITKLTMERTEDHY